MTHDTYYIAKIDLMGLVMPMERICKTTCYSDCKLDEGGAETSEGDAEENPAQVSNYP